MKKVTKYSFDEAVQIINKLPKDTDVIEVENIIRKTRKTDKSAVLDYAVLSGFNVMDE